MAERELTIITEIQDNATDEINQLKDTVGGMQGLFSSVAKWAAAAFAAITAGVVGAVNEFSKFETAEVAFESLTGSAEGAVKMMEELKVFSAETPFRFENVANAGKVLMAFGIEAENVQDRLKFLGDIASGANIPLNEMANIYGKVQTKGKAMTKEIKQMAERGIPIIGVLAEQFGVAEAQIFEMAESGQLTADVVENALRSMSEEGGMFENQTQKQAETIAGLWSTLQDNVQLAFAAIGDAFDTEAKAMIEGVTDIVKSIREWIEDNKTLVKWSIIITGALAGILAVGAGIAALYLSAGAAAWAFTAAQTALAGATWAAVTPMLPFVAGIMAIVAAVALLIVYWDDLVDAFSMAWDNIVNTFMGVKDKMLEILDTILEIPKKIASGYIDILKSIPIYGDMVEGGMDMIGVNDALIKSDGEVVKFHPDDDILAMKDFGKLSAQGGGGGTVVNMTVEFKGGYYLDRNAGRKIAETLRDEFGKDIKIS